MTFVRIEKPFRIFKRDGIWLATHLGIIVAHHRDFDGIIRLMAYWPPSGRRF